MEEYTKYVGAPYNFIEMNEKVYEKQELPGHDVIEENRCSGVLGYEIDAKTPIIVDDGTEHFYKNAYGKTAIPGSTMRGLVRNNLQILSFSSIADDVQDGRLMYRNVANGKDKDRYNALLGNKSVPVPDAHGKNKQMSVLLHVKAGYIRNSGNEYSIVPTVVDSISESLGEMNYYVLSERKIIEGKYRNFEYLRDQKPYRLQNNNGSFEHFMRGGREHYKGKENRDYHPYFQEISYELSGGRRVTGIAQKGKLKKNGYLLSSGKMQEKKVIYVIPEIDDKKECISVPQEDIDDFKRDYESRKNQVEVMDKNFFRLPEDGEIKPVFYIRLGGKLYFGFTPRLRMFYDKRIFDGIKDSHKNAGRDYCKSIFGYTNQGKDGESYKSRAVFMDAVLLEGNESGETSKVILGAPKPTSYLDYLTADKARDIVSYNDDFEIRGVKQYWLKDKADAVGDVTKEKVASVLHPYREGARFKGEIRFENLTDEELGMLLWSLVLEENSNQNIGKAKPYGYGRIAVKLTKLQLLDYEALYDVNQLSLTPYVDVLDKAGDYITKAKADMSSFLGREVMEVPRIKHFFMMKDAGNIPSSDRTRYMSIQDKEYQNRVTSQVKLPTVEDVREGKKPMTNRGSDPGKKPNGRNGSGVGGNKGNNYKKQGKGKKGSESVYKDSGSFSNTPFSNLQNLIDNSKK